MGGQVKSNRGSPGLFVVSETGDDWPRLAVRSCARSCRWPVRASGDRRPAQDQSGLTGTQISTTCLPSDSAFRSIG